MNNIKLEVVNITAHHDMLAQHVNTCESTVRNSTDNIAMVWWQRKCATSTSGPTTRLYIYKFCNNYIIIIFNYTITLQATTMPGLALYRVFN
jgi:hypothetical protein